jgi:hypothetical protein
MVEAGIWVCVLLGVLNVLLELDALVQYVKEKQSTNIGFPANERSPMPRSAGSMQHSAAYSRLGGVPVHTNFV